MDPVNLEPILRCHGGGLKLALTWDGNTRHHDATPNAAAGGHQTSPARSSRRPNHFSCTQTGRIVSPQPERSRAIGGCPASTQRWSLPDSPTLRTLRADVGDAAAVDQFVSDFLGLVEGRLDRLGALLTDERFEAAETLLLSLESSAHMIGADPVSESAYLLRHALRIGGPEPLPADLVAPLDRLREEARRLLDSATLARPTGPTPAGSPATAAPERPTLERTLPER